MGDVWVRIAEFPDYAVSGDGRVMRVTNGRGLTKAGRILRVYSGNQYPQVVLGNNGKFRTRTTHILVAEAFVPNPENKPEVNHKDGDHSNSLFSNLEWATHAENMEHSAINKLQCYGEAHHNAKLSRNKARDILRMLGEGIPQRRIARMFGVTQGLISQIKTGLLWKEARNVVNLTKN